VAEQVVSPAAYSVEGFIKSLGISRSTFYAEVRAGRLHPVKLGARTLVPASEAARYMAMLIAEAERTPEAS
jgi:hypothetical protein